MATATSAAAPLAPASAGPRGRARAGGLPPGPRLPSLAQTLLWALAPTWLMDRCSERLGESFTLTFWPSGMQLVMISDPDAVKDAVHGAARARALGGGQLAGRAGDGAELGDRAHRARAHAPAQAAAAAVPRRAHARVRGRDRARRRARDMAGWPLGRPMRLQRAHARDHARGDPARGVRRRGRADGRRCEAAIGALLAPVQHADAAALRAEPPSSSSARRARSAQALDRLDALIYEEIARRREQGDLQRARGHPLAADAGARRGRARR